MNGLTNRKHFAWVIDAAPAHVGDVEKSVHALKVNKRTKVGDVLDDSIDLVADFNGLKELSTLLSTLSFNNFTTAQNDVLADVVNFNDFKFVNLTNVFVEVFRWNDVDL